MTSNPKAEVAGASELAELYHLISVCIPHGSIVAAQVVHTESGLKVSVQVRGMKSTIEHDDGLRQVDPEELVVALALSLYGGHAHIKNISPRRKPDDLPPQPGQHDNHYVYAFRDERGITWQRLFTGAGPREEVKLGPDHRNLCMETLSLVPSAGRTWQGRPEAIEEALHLHAKATEKGHPLGFSARAYEAILRRAFKLLDDTHGHKLRRQALPAPAEAAE